MPPIRIGAGIFSLTAVLKPIFTLKFRRFSFEFIVQMATAARWEDDGDWELINDDGFVYKRRKRSCPDPTIAASTSAPPPPDPAVEERNLRQRKKSVLLKLKERFQKEILQWEHLSNTLSEMQKKAQIAQPQMPQNHAASVSSLLPAESTVSQCRGIVDELLSQVVLGFVPPIVLQSVDILGFESIYIDFVG